MVPASASARALLVPLAWPVVGWLSAVMNRGNRWPHTHHPIQVPHHPASRCPPRQAERAVTAHCQHGRQSTPEAQAVRHTYDPPNGQSCSPTGSSESGLMSSSTTPADRAQIRGRWRAPRVMSAWLTSLGYHASAREARRVPMALVSGGSGLAFVTQSRWPEGWDRQVSAVVTGRLTQYG